MPAGTPACRCFCQSIDPVYPDGMHVAWRSRNDSNRSAWAILFREMNTPTWYYLLIDSTWNFLTPSGDDFAVNTDYDVSVGAVDTNGYLLYDTSNPARVRVSAALDQNNGTAVGFVTDHAERLPSMQISVLGSGEPTDSRGEFRYELVPNGRQQVGVDSARPEWDRLLTDVDVPAGGESAASRIFTRLRQDTVPPTVSWLTLPATVRNLEEIEIDVAANDDVATRKLICIRYSREIQSGSILGSLVFGLYEWLVRMICRQVGYTLRAVARDYQGNESVPFASNEFTILEDHIPTVDFMAGLPRTIAPGRTMMISVNVSDDVSVTEVDYSYFRL